MRSHPFKSYIYIYNQVPYYFQLIIISSLRVCNNINCNHIHYSWIKVVCNFLFKFYDTIRKEIYAINTKYTLINTIRPICPKLKICCVDS